MPFRFFESITPNITIDPAQPLGNKIQVSYHLKPSRKQLFLIEPRATNSNGFLGVSASVSYINKNLFRGADKLKLSFSGGLESQPPVFDNTTSGSGEVVSRRTLNTFELSPKVSFELPKLFPLPRGLQKTLSKRLYPATIFDLSYNFQRRNDFDRNITEFGYSWKFSEDKSKTRQIKWQSLNYVKLDKNPFFEQKLAQLNDPFILNSYNDHFSNKFQFTENDINFKYKNVDAYRKLQYGLTVSAGYTDFNAYVFYGLTPIFENAKFNGEDINTRILKFGLIFYIL